MVKKLFMLFSVGMTVYTFYMIRMRPGKMFENPISKIVNNTQSSKSVNKIKNERHIPNSRSELDLDNTRVVISKGSGDVYVKRLDRSINVEEGFELKYKDQLITGKNSVVVLKFAGNSIIKLFSNAEFHIGRIQHQDRSDTGTQFNFFHLERGAIMVDFINRGKMHFLELTSKASKLQIKGTQFLLLHNQNKERTQLAVLEGIVKATSIGLNDSKFVGESHGVLIKANETIATPTSKSWVEKINWAKVAKGSGIDLYNKNFSPEEKKEWQKRRKMLEQMPTGLVIAKKINKAEKSKSGSLIKNVVGKVFDVAKKGASGLKSASPVGQLNEAAENMKNLEQSQKDRMKALDSLE